MSRLSQLVQDVPDPTRVLTLRFGYNPASQIVTHTRSNDLFASAPVGGTQTATANGLNQLTQIGGTSTSHDARGNMTNDGTNSYVYNSQNLMTSGPGGVTLTYDPLGRLYEISGGSGGTRRLQYDGADTLLAWDGAGNRIEVYVHGPGVDEPLVWYDIPTGARRFLHADERGTIVAVSDDAGSTIAVNRYDEYGVPATGNVGRFQYTGQPWIAEIGLQYSRARMYNPRLGRFMQTDPIEYGDGMNLYAYVGGDPVNRVDPTGLSDIDVCGGVRVNGDCVRHEIVFPVIWLAGSEGESGESGGGGGAIPTKPPRRRTTCPRNKMRVTREGDRVKITGRIQFRYGDYNTARRTAPLASHEDATTYIGMINDFWTGTFGAYRVSTRLERGSKGITALIGNPGAGGVAVLGGDIMWLWPLHPADWPDVYNQARGRLAAHEFGHNLGLNHDAKGLMHALAGGPVLESHITQVLERCGVGDS